MNNIKTYIQFNESFISNLGKVYRKLFKPKRHTYKLSDLTYLDDLKKIKPKVDKNGLTHISNDNDWFDAAKNGNLEIIMNKIESGINVNCQNQFLETALHLSSANNQIDIVKELLNVKEDIEEDISGIDINIQDQILWTPLMWAVYEDNFDIVKILVKSGANLNIQNDLNRTALMMSIAYTKDVDMMNYLINGSDVDIVDVYKRNALILASIDNEYKIIEKLETLSNKNQIDIKGKTYKDYLKNA